ncbi:hypothetical protein ACFE04_014379 [Oxalis oulophora]
MSRCFPFPPPGYVKKTKADDIDLLKKPYFYFVIIALTELFLDTFDMDVTTSISCIYYCIQISMEKHKEKKHKKEKKDKEKKESKEKREKDRSDGKHRDKKDKKDKHREKKDRDKDKNQTPDDKRLFPGGQSESHNGANAPDDKKLSRKPDHSGEKFIGREREKDAMDKTSVTAEKKVGGQIPSYHGEKLPPPPAPHSRDSKFVQDLARRGRDEEKAVSNQLAEKFIATDQKGGEGVAKLVAKTSGTWTEGKEKTKDNRGGDRKLEDGQGIKDRTKSKSPMAQNLPGLVQLKAEGIPKPLDRNVDMQIKGKSLKVETWQNKGDDNKLPRVNKHGENNKEEKNREKNKSKEKAKKENVKDISELNKNAGRDKFREGSMVDHMDRLKTKSSELPKDSEMSTVPGEILKKRKDHESNGFLHANDSKPNKLPRLIPSSDRSIQNGRTVELNHMPTTCTSDKQGAANYIISENKKDHKPNGIIELQPKHVSPANPSLKTVQADRITEPRIKPPHPDMKYLTEILAVPKLEEMSDFDDQDWLFQKPGPHLKQSEAEDPLEVWSEARWIESGDIFALPYSHDSFKKALSEMASATLLSLRKAELALCPLKRVQEKLSRVAYFDDPQPQF